MGRWVDGRNDIEVGRDTFCCAAWHLAGFLGAVLFEFRFLVWGYD